MSHADFLAMLDTTLRDAREALARQVDRTEALAEVWNRAVAVQAGRDYPIDLPDLYAAASGERERAELEAILERAAKETP